MVQLAPGKYAFEAAVQDRERRQVGTLRNPRGSSRGAECCCRRGGGAGSRAGAPEPAQRPRSFRIRRAGDAEPRPPIAKSANPNFLPVRGGLAEARTLLLPRSRRVLQGRQEDGRGQGRSASGGREGTDGILGEYRRLPFRPGDTTRGPGDAGQRAAETRPLHDRPLSAWTAARAVRGPGSLLRGERLRPRRARPDDGRMRPSAKAWRRSGAAPTRDLAAIRGRRRLLREPERNVFHFLGAWLIDTAFHDVLFHPAITVKAAQLLGVERLRFWHDQVFYKPPRHPGVVTWHQDYSYWTRSTPAGHVTCWIGLDDSTLENGCVHYVPGSHRWGLCRGSRSRRTWTP